jgi:hypothetical protein
MTMTSYLRMRLIAVIYNSDMWMWSMRKGSPDSARKYYSVWSRDIYSLLVIRYDKWCTYGSTLLCLSLSLSFSIAISLSLSTLESVLKVQPTACLLEDGPRIDYIYVIYISHTYVVYVCVQCGCVCTVWFSVTDHPTRPRIGMSFINMFQSHKRPTACNQLPVHTG